MKDKILALYWIDYDLEKVKELGFITEDKIDEYIQYHISKSFDESPIKFKVIEILKKPDHHTVVIKIMYDEYNKQPPFEGELYFLYIPINNIKINEFKNNIITYGINYEQ